MAIDTREMRENRHKLLLTARELLDKADAEKRTLTAEEKANQEKALADSEEWREKIDAAEKRNDLDRQIAETALSQDKSKTDEENRTGETNEERTLSRGWETQQYRTLWSRSISEGTRHFSNEEHRQLSAGTATEGGYLYAPEEFVNELIKNVTDMTHIRSVARQFSVAGADSLGFPVLTNRMAAAEWTSELGTASTDSTLDFGKRELRPNPATKEIVVSKVLLRKTPMAEQIVREELARVMAEGMENGYMTGTGAQQPLGVFTASGSGISTDRDVSTGNTSSSPTPDGLKNALYTLKASYWNNAVWIMHRNTMLLLAKMKDGNGRYLLQDSIVQGEPTQLLGKPILLSEYAPSAYTTGLYVAVLGDFSNYWIVDSLDMEVLQLRELYARNNKDCFIVRMMSDGAPVREEAFVRVKLG